MRTVVCNSSPLITLAKADLLEILPKQFSTLLVPEAVEEEILRGPENDPMRMQVDKLPWLEPIRLEPPLTPLAYWQLGKGESEVIEYARRHSNVTALLDDKDARRVACVLQIPVVGTLGVVAIAARQSGPGAFNQMVQRLRESGIYLDEKVISSVRAGLGQMSA